MPIRCRITGINGSALLEMSCMRSYMRGDTAGHFGTKERSFMQWPFAFLAHASLAFDLWALREAPLQMAWMCFAAHCSPRYQPLSPCYSPAPPPQSDSHTPVAEPTDRAESWHVSSSPGSASVQLGKLSPKRRKVGVLQQAQIQRMF